MLSNRLEVAQARLGCQAKRFTTIAHDRELAFQGAIVFESEQANQSSAARNYRGLCKRLSRMDSDDHLAIERELDECLSQFASGCRRPAMASGEARGEDPDRERLLERSLALVRSLLDLGPVSRELVFRVLEVSRQLDAVDQAAQLIRDRAEAWTVEPKAHDAKPWMEAGVALASLGEAMGDAELDRAACGKFARAVEAEPDDAGAWGYWGFTLGRLADMTQDVETRTDLLWQACEKFSRAVEAEPGFHQAWGNWAAALGRLAGVTEDRAAQADLRRQVCEKYAKAAEIKPGDHRAWYYWGAQLRRMADTTEDPEARADLRSQACEKYAKTVEIKPDDARAWYDWGAALHNLASATGDRDAQTDLWSQAGEKYAKAVAINPHDHRAWYYWGALLHKVADATDDIDAQAASRSQACDKYAKAAALRPDDHRAWYYWGAALHKMACASHSPEAQADLRREAGEKYAKTIAIKPDKRRAWRNWGAALHNLADVAGDAQARTYLLRQACEKYAKTVEIKPDDHHAWRYWGEALRETYTATGEEHLLSEAREKCHRAEEIKSSVAAAYALARIESLAENVDDGLRWLAQAVKHRDDGATFAINDPYLARLRRETRFWVIVGRPGGKMGPDQC